MTKRVVFNPFSQAFRQNPYPTYRDMRESGVFRALGMWVLSRHDDVKATLRDRRFSSALIPAIVQERLAGFGMECPEVSMLGRKAIVFTDNPEHARLRRLTNDVFRWELLDALRPAAQRIMRDHVDAWLREPGRDFIAHVARPAPLKLLLAWMDIDGTHMEDVARWNHAVRYFLEPGTVTREQFARIYVSLTEFLAFFMPCIASRQNGRGTDFIGRMVAARDVDDGLSDEEIANMCVMAFVAGAETTQALLGNALWLLASHPAQYSKLTAREVSVSDAVNEILRFESPLQMTKRIAMEDVTLGGTTIRAGDHLLLCLGAANHDASRFRDPEAFDLGRANADAHLGFGYGAHACLGAHLAQIQLEALLDMLLARNVRQLVCTHPPEWQSNSVIMRGLTSLSLTLDCAKETEFADHRIAAD